MIKLLYSIILMVLTPFAGDLQHGLSIGSSMPRPEMKMKDISGDLVSLREAMGPEGLLVMFSCNTCPYVIKNQSRTNAVCQFAKNSRVGVILLNPSAGGRNNGESLTDMQQYARQQHFDWYYALDSDNDMADAFSANRTPECFLFDKNARLVYHGAIDDSPADISEVKRNHLRLAIAEMTAGSAVSVKESRSIGCSIRRKSN